jgi:pyruvate carboxylase
VADRLDVEVDDEDLMGYLMYPKVFTDYATRHKAYGPVRTLPTRTFFYGMEPGEEIEAEIDPGKTLVIRLPGRGRDQRGGRGPRVLRAERPAAHDPGPQPQDRREPGRAPKAEAGNPNHVGAPMPGVVASVAVSAGQKVKQGDLLLTIEAMKMETGIHAERDAVVKAVHVARAGRSTPRTCWWS